ncbi:BrnA antitoxin family protein [Massilia sp. CFBP 13647]|nr:BrnA antitoxin family protein [Massilia sp. CFBP 13647]
MMTPTPSHTPNSTHGKTAAPLRRTRPPKRKTRITIYLDDEVLNEFRTLSERCGTGYQTLINAALRTRLAAAGIEPGLL